MTNRFSKNKPPNFAAKPREATQQQRNLHDPSSWVERINYYIARLLGKKPHKVAAGTKISNGIFCLVVLCCVLLLWISTGFYYLANGEFALVLTDGKVVKVTQGMTAGFTLPYPLGDIVVIDGDVGEMLDLNQINQLPTTYTILAQDLVPLRVDAKFSYQVTNPILVFRKLLAQHTSLDTTVAMIIQQQLHSYLAKTASANLRTANLTVLADTLKRTMNAQLSHQGIKLTKFNVVTLRFPSLTASAVTTPTTYDNGKTNNLIQATRLAKQLLLEAKQYKVAALHIESGLMMNQPEIPLGNYPLLSLSLAQLLRLSTTWQESSNLYGRNLVRGTNRIRGIDPGNSDTSDDGD